MSSCCGGGVNASRFGDEVGVAGLLSKLVSIDVALVFLCFFWLSLSAKSTLLCFFPAIFFEKLCSSTSSVVVRVVLSWLISVCLLLFAVSSRVIRVDFSSIIFSRVSFSFLRVSISRFAFSSSGFST